MRKIPCEYCPALYWGTIQNSNPLIRSHLVSHHHGGVWILWEILWHGPCSFTPLPHISSVVDSNRAIKLPDIYIACRRALPRPFVPISIILMIIPVIKVISTNALVNV